MHCNVCSKHTRPQGFNKEATRNRTHGRTLLLHRIDESQQDFLPLCLNSGNFQLLKLCAQETPSLAYSPETYLKVKMDDSHLFKLEL